MLLIDLPVL